MMSSHETLDEHFKPYVSPNITADPKIDAFEVVRAAKERLDLLGSTHRRQGAPSGSSIHPTPGGHP